MISTGEFLGYSIYKDHWKVAETNLTKKTVFNLWMHLCRKNERLTIDQMVEIFPYFEDKLHLWDQCCGENGKINMNGPEYKAYMEKRAKRRAANKLKKEADAKKKKMM